MALISYRSSSGSPIVELPAAAAAVTAAAAAAAACARSSSIASPSSSNRACLGRSRGAALRRSSNPVSRRLAIVKCSSGFAGDNLAAERFVADDDNYVNSTVLEAVEVKSGSQGFMIKMRDGRHIRCEHNNVEGGHLPDYAPQPAIVLKMDDDTDLLLPIIVLELPCNMLMEALRNAHVARPTVYHVMKDMIELMGYQPLLVRVTKRVHEAYYARLFLSKEEDGRQRICSLDVRPSDGINLAVRCKIPIQVNKQLVYGDGVRIIQEPVQLSFKASALGGAEAGSCTAAEEFVLVRNMMVAAVEERYNDAARLRDQLSKLRANKKREQEA